MVCPCWAVDGRNPVIQVPVLDGRGEVRSKHLVMGALGFSRFESLILSHHSRFTRECNKEGINDDDGNDDLLMGLGFI